MESSGLLRGKEMTLEEYTEKVYYCKRCHSLYILGNDGLANDDWDGSYCGKCNSTDVGICTMGEWMEEEERREKIRKEREWNR